jgi:hypothetical protein
MTSLRQERAAVLFPIAPALWRRQRAAGAVGEQRDAFDRITAGQGLASVIGYAGTGKSAMLGVARDGSAKAIRCAARPCPGSRPRIWRGIGHQVAHHRQP